MRILFLDDEEARHEVFSKDNPDVEVCHVYTVKQFDSALQTGVRWDEIHLDHDLSEFEYIQYGGGQVQKREWTGLDACRLIACLAPELRPGLVVIHSWNTPGAIAMQKILNDESISTWRRPFGPPYR